MPMTTACHDKLVKFWEDNFEALEGDLWDFAEAAETAEWEIFPNEFYASFFKHHDEVFEDIDCIKCANCCKIIGIQLSESDIERFADYFNMSKQDLIDKYNLKTTTTLINDVLPFFSRLYPHEYVITYGREGNGCAFLGEDDKCTVYDIRPDFCKEYPYTRTEFGMTLDITYSQCKTCPAAFNIWYRARNELEDRNIKRCLTAQTE